MLLVTCVLCIYVGLSFVRLAHTLQNQLGRSRGLSIHPEQVGHDPGEVGWDVDHSIVWGWGVRGLCTISEC